MAWVEKRLRGAKVWMLADEQGQPQCGPDNRVEIVYRPGGKAYRAAVNNLQEATGAPVVADEEMRAMAAAEQQAEKIPEKSPSLGLDLPSLPAHSMVRVVLTAPELSVVPIHVYTDGACTGNPGPMGIGVVILDAGSQAPRRELSEYLGVGTNNIAELTAIERGIVKLPRNRPVIVYSDSSYSIGVLAQGWKAKKNQELIAQLRRLLGEFSEVYFIKVAGHAGIPENERCDELARQAIITMNRERP